MENLNVVNPAVAIPEFDIMMAQQEAFMKAMTGGLSGSTTPSAKPSKSQPSDDLADIKSQLAALQDKLSKL